MSVRIGSPNLSLSQKAATTPPYWAIWESRNLEHTGNGWLKKGLLRYGGNLVSRFVTFYRKLSRILIRSIAILAIKPENKSRVLIGC